MKLLLIALILLTASCKKEKNGNCYNCQIVANGVGHEQKMCGSADGRYYDKDGNELQCIQIH